PAWPAPAAPRPAPARPCGLPWGLGPRAAPQPAIHEVDLMTPQEQQLIESLFQRLTQGAAQSGPRDPQAEALIEQRVQSLPGAAYYMTQTLLVQERALQQAEARLASQPQQSSFLPPSAAPGQQYPYAAAPPYAGPAYQQQSGGGAGSFLAGAGKIALGVVGGVLVA